MQPIDKEQLVQLVTREVLRILSQATPTPQPVTTDDELFWQGSDRVITLIGLEPLLTKKFTTLVVPDRIIITPAVTDFFKARGIRIKTRSRLALEQPATGVHPTEFALIAPRIRPSQLQPVTRAFEQKKVNFSLIDLPAYGPQWWEGISATALRTKQGHFAGLIILDERAASTAGYIKRASGLDTVTGWNVDIVAEKCKSVRMPILLINPNLFSAAKTAEMIAIWLASFDQDR